MVRNYVRKTERNNYSKNDIQNAMDAVKNGVMSIKKASKAYKVPRTTLYCYISGRRSIVNVDSFSLGRNRAIPRHQEIVLAKGIKALQKWGFELSRKEILTFVSKFVVQNDIKTPFKNNVPGSDWYASFKTRYRIATMKKVQNLDFATHKMFELFYVNRYYFIVENLTNRLNLAPEQLWNITETIISPLKAKSAKHLDPNSPENDNISVLTAISAAGEKVPPLIVFKGKYVCNQWRAEPEDGVNIHYAANSTGNLDSNTFSNYFKNTFLPSLSDRKPLVIIYGGNNTNIDFHTTDLLQQNNIILIKFPLTLRISQPIDIAFFQIFKAVWNEESKNVKQGTKEPFSQLFQNIWKNLLPETIKIGFEKTGMFPFDNTLYITKEKFLPEVLQIWEDYIQQNQQETFELDQDFLDEFIKLEEAENAPIPPFKIKLNDNYEPAFSQSSSKSKESFTNDPLCDDIKVEINGESSDGGMKTEVNTTKKDDNVLKDEDFYFAMSLIPFLRKLPEEKKLAVRIKMLKILNDD